MADFSEIVKKHTAEDGSIPATAIEALVTAIKQATGNEYVDKERYKAKLSEIETLKAEKQTAEDAAQTAEAWKGKHKTLKDEFDAYKASVAAEKSKAAKEKAATT